MKIKIINGPNLNKLHLRDKKLYSGYNIKQINEMISNEFKSIEFEFVQSNSEDEIISEIHSSAESYDGIIINPAAFSHTSIAIRDAIEICKIPVVEVHLSNLSARENFRHTMITASKSLGYISGFSQNGYLIAVYALLKIITEK